MRVAELYLEVRPELVLDSRIVVGDVCVVGQRIHATVHPRNDPSGGQMSNNYTNTHNIYIQCDEIELWEVERCWLVFGTGRMLYELVEINQYIYFVDKFSVFYPIIRE